MAGDTLFRESIGRTDLPGGDGKQILRSIHDKLLGLPGDTQVIPGHGDNTTIEHEKQFNYFLKGMRDKMRATKTRAAVLPHARGARGGGVRAFGRAGNGRGTAARGGLRDLSLRPLRLRPGEASAGAADAGSRRHRARGSGGARGRRSGRRATGRALPFWGRPAEAASGAARGASASAPSRPISDTRCKGRWGNMRSCRRRRWCGCRRRLPRRSPLRCAARDGRHTARCGKPG